LSASWNTKEVLSCLFDEIGPSKFPELNQDLYEIYFGEYIFPDKFVYPKQCNNSSNIKELRSEFKNRILNHFLTSDCVEAILRFSLGYIMMCVLSQSELPILSCMRMTNYEYNTFFILTYS
jgi:hypothetical protein